jgi:hypothetical protein
VKTLKAILNFVVGLLAVAKWLPFLSQYRTAFVAVSALLTGLLSLVSKCDATDAAKPQPTVTATPKLTPSPTPIHTPSPSPTPTPTPEIVLDRVPYVGWPFTVRYTAPFEYKHHIWIDKYRLQVLGKEAGTGYHIAYSVVLNTGGKRLLTVRDNDGNVLASKMIEVSDAK